MKGNDAIILAAAGLIRLGLGSHPLGAAGETSLPAAGQARSRYRGAVVRPE